MSSTIYEEIMRLAPLLYLPQADAVGSSTAKDVSGHGANATVNGTVTFGQSPLLKASVLTSALYDGSTGYLSGSSGITSTSGAFSAGMWVDASRFGTDGSGISYRIAIRNIDGTQSFQFVADTGGVFSFQVTKSGGVGTGSGSGFATGTNYLLIGTWDGTTALLYVNKTVQGHDGTSNYGLGNTGFNIGRRTDGGGYYQGQIAHYFEVAGVVLTPDQINRLNNVGNGAEGIVRGSHRAFGRLL